MRDTLDGGFDAAAAETVDNTVKWKRYPHNNHVQNLPSIISYITSSLVNADEITI